jgi:hypothetical protein
MWAINIKHLKLYGIWNGRIVETLKSVLGELIKTLEGRVLCLNILRIKDLLYAQQRLISQIKLDYKFSLNIF